MQKIAALGKEGAYSGSPARRLLPRTRRREATAPRAASQQGERGRNEDEDFSIY